MPKLSGLTALVSAVVVSALALSGCSGAAGPAPSTSTSETDPRPLVLTTFTVLADMAREVGGDAVRVESITKVGAEIHGYEPTPSDLTRAQDADLILDNGLGLEGWFDQFTRDLDAPTVTLTDGIRPVLISVGDYEGRPNPHAWMSPAAGETYVDNIAAALTDLVPDAAAEITGNAAAYKGELSALSDELTAAVAAIPTEQRLLVTCEGAFSYLARDAGLDEGYLWAVNQESQGTPRQVTRLIDTVRDRGVRTIFCESTVSDAAQRVVADEAGATLGGTLYVDSLSDGAPVPTYLELLRYDIRTIVEGLTE
ncbi:MAG TPA: metal ABC transporter substrate-binding protein [Cryobacterium sp.]|nr:metal ABC transporter substrate-binding protein [Cryobacterium sp.]